MESEHSDGTAPVPERGILHQWVQGRLAAGALKWWDRPPKARKGRFVLIGPNANGDALYLSSLESGHVCLTTGNRKHSRAEIEDVAEITYKNGFLSISGTDNGTRSTLVYAVSGLVD